MTRVRTLLLRAFVGVLVLLCLGAGVASADTGVSGDSGGGSIQELPQDPGIGE